MIVKVLKHPILVSGFKKGLSGYAWILKILLPVSLLTFLMDYSGLLQGADFFLSPVMGMLGLSASAALPLIIGVLTGIYGAVAAMSALPLSAPEMTLIAIFLLISHNLIQESLIQGKSGFHPVKAALFRLGVSLITVWIVGRILGEAPADPRVSSASVKDMLPFMDAISAWAIKTGGLCVKIFAIIMILMFVLDALKASNLIPAILRLMNPILRIMGLDREVGMLWLTAAFFGITYGAAVIVQEARENTFSEASLCRLHLSIGVNHAMVEDPALFLSLGIGPFWLWIPRLIAAICVVWIYALYRRARSRFQWSIARPSAGAGS